MQAVGTTGVCENPEPCKFGGRDRRRRGCRRRRRWRHTKPRALFRDVNVTTLLSLRDVNVTAFLAPRPLQWWLLQA